MLNENRFLGTFRGHSKRPISREYHLNVNSKLSGNCELNSKLLPTNCTCEKMLSSLICYFSTTICNGVVSAGPSRMGGCGGCDPPLKTRCRQMKGFVGKRTGHYQSCQVSRFTRESPGFRADLQVSRLVLKISRTIKMVLYAWISATPPPPPPPSLLGKQSKSDNIRFTVGQYWLIIKKNGTNSVNFVRNCVIL